MPMLNPRFYTLLGIVLAVSLYRVIPHAPNFTPVLAVALFSGAHFSDRRTAILVSLLGMLLADFFLGFHPTIVFVYVSILMIVILGGFLKTRKAMPVVLLATVMASLLFFVLTNFGAWLSLPAFYSRDLDGLLAAYIAAIPFYQNTLLSSLLFSALLFGGFRLIEQFHPRLVSDGPGR
jgi:hypothetical protein